MLRTAAPVIPAEAGIQGPAARPTPTVDFSGDAAVDGAENRSRHCDDVHSGAIPHD